MHSFALYCTVLYIQYNHHRYILKCEMLDERAPIPCQTNLHERQNEAQWNDATPFITSYLSKSLLAVKIADKTLSMLHFSETFIRPRCTFRWSPWNDLKLELRENICSRLSRQLFRAIKKFFYSASYSIIPPLSAKWCPHLKRGDKQRDFDCNEAWKIYI